MILYRPVGLNELRLIYENRLGAFPPRLTEQPIFYPVLNFEYACQIARDWDAKSEPYAGYVTESAIADSYATQFERHVVGALEHEEFWIPADRLDQFNQHIIKPIKVVEAYFGSHFQGFVPENFGMKGMNAARQFSALANTLNYSRMDFYVEITANHLAVFLNYPFWLKHDFTNDGISDNMKRTTLEAVRESWLRAYPEIPLMIASTGH